MTDSQVWYLSWHEGFTPPPGTPHGSAGICVTRAGQVVLVSENGETWDVPGGRPEGRETLKATLHREVLEEACARVRSATLLGFAHAECLTGREKGHVIVRSFWRARVEVLDWLPRFETTHRILIAPTEVLEHTFPGFAPVYHRVLKTAGLLGA